jgi:hypothetical protein
MPLVVYQQNDLRNILRPEGILHPFRKPRLLIRIPHMPESEAMAWESRLEELRQACGCSGGALSLGAFVFGFVAVSLVNGSAVTGNLQLREHLLLGGIFLSGVIVSSLLGKLIGLCLTQVRYRRVCLRLQDRLRQLDA